ncbi:hypothetical protein [Nocardia gamkensis]|uniref:hypothetical protein n=1 Tax=Nocardia gamkensis TaxID=352869 RepID=UPI0037C568FF
MIDNPNSRSHTCDDRARVENPPSEGPGFEPPQRRAGQADAVQVATRSGRYALMAAVFAAIVSSFVSASAAVYTSISSADRSEEISIGEATRENRQKVYTDFLSATYAFAMQLGRMAEYLNIGDRDGFGSEAQQFADTEVKSMVMGDLVAMTCGSGMSDVIERIQKAHVEFLNMRYGPFVGKVRDKSAHISADEKRRGNAALRTAMIDFASELDKLLGEFHAQGRKDLGIA